MNPPLIEAVPNFSEGRDPARINRIVRRVEQVEGIEVLDLHSDPDHHRSVLTLWGPPDPVKEAMMELARACIEEIDLNRHQGVHPRIGSLDVVPLVPVKGITRQELTQPALELARRMAVELSLPVYLYADLARSASRRELADIRRGGFEGLREKMQDPAWQPDFGPSNPHPTAGATCVGVRGYLVAYNLYLATPDPTVARKIAARIRTRDGGPPGVKALGFALPSAGAVQVSMNLTEPERTNPLMVRRLVEELAEQLGTQVIGGELVGMVPAEVVEAMLRQSFADNFLADKILDWRRWQGK